MGMTPLLRPSILAAFLSTQTTSLPRSEKTTPVTRPTYPVPITQMFMGNYYSLSRICLHPLQIPCQPVVQANRRV